MKRDDDATTTETTTMPPTNGIVDGSLEKFTEADPRVHERTLTDFVPFHKTFVDMTYGRVLNPVRVAALEPFIVGAMGSLLLSLRPDGRYAILDGQHRIAQAIAHGVAAWHALVYLDLTVEEEAKLYGHFAYKYQQTAVDLFKAKLAAKEPPALAIMGILRRHGLSVSRGGERRSISAVSALEQAYGMRGSQVLDESLGVLVEAFGDHERGYSGHAIMGMTHFWVRYGSVVDRRRLVTKLVQLGPDGVHQRANAIRAAFAKCNMYTAWGRAIHEAYNVGLRTQMLPDWQERIYSEVTKPAAKERSLAALKKANEARRGGRSA